LSLLRSLSCMSESHTCRPPQARKRSYLCPAVDQHGNILDILVSRWRGKGTAKTFCRKLFKGLREIPRVFITDK
jgi:transposase-like protein